MACGEDLYVLGGASADVGALNSADLYKFSTGSKTWETLNGINGLNLMPRRMFPAMVVASDGFLYVFGGYNFEVLQISPLYPHLDDFWKFDPQTQTLHRLTLDGTSPGGRWSVSLFVCDKSIADGVGDSLYLHGGSSLLGNLRMNSPFITTLLTFMTTQRTNLNLRVVPFGDQVLGEMSQSTGTIFGDFWNFDLQTLTWDTMDSDKLQIIGEIPAERS